LRIISNEKAFDGKTETNNERARIKAFDDKTETNNGYAQKRKAEENCK